MSKRKLETADEESAAPEQYKRTKKRKTNTTRASKALPQRPEIKGLARGDLDRRSEKLARRLAKRENKAPEDQNRNESGRKDGVKTGDYDGSAGVVGLQETKPLEKGRTAALKNRHESRERGNEGSPKSEKKHKSKSEKRKDRIVQLSGKKGKEKDVGSATWNVSDPLGGQLLDVDPVFSLDEK